MAENQTLRFLHVITGCVITGNVCGITEITKGQTVISGTWHFYLLSAVTVVDFSNDSRAFSVIFKGGTVEPEREKNGCHVSTVEGSDVARRA